MSDEKFIIEKRGLYYRPNARGYTGLKSEAGRYSFEEAVLHVGPNGPEGPQDGLCMWRESETPDYSSNCPWDVKRIDEAERKAYREGFSAGVRHADEEAALKALADMGQEWDADTAAAQVAAAYERGAELFDEKHHVFMVAKGRNPSDYMSEFSNAADKLRALATDTQTNALEQVRREAERAGYERGVREAASRALHAMKGYTHRIGKGDRYALGVQAGAVRAKDEILGLLDNPTPDPDEPTKAQDLAFRKAVSS